jgi:hypothetical protein
LRSFSSEFSRTKDEFSDTLLGHANRDVTDKYAEQLKEDLEWRKSVAEKTGLGFTLPSLEFSVGQLGQPNAKKNEVVEAA